MVCALKRYRNAKDAFERVATTNPRQWLYLFDDEGVVFSETHSRFAGLDAAGVSAYRAFDAGARVEDLRKYNGAHNLAPASADALETIHALSQGTFPAEDASADWPVFAQSKVTNSRPANIEIYGIPVSLEYPAGPLEHLCQDYFQNCTPATQSARCHLSAQFTEKGWAILVNGREFFLLQREEQLGLGLMHAARSLLYAEGKYDVAFHAAMVAYGDCGVMLSAPREYGKSTLAAYLVSQGFDLLTDEPVLLDLNTCTAASLCLPISLKQASWSVLRPQWPQLADAPIHVRSDGMEISLVHPPIERCSAGPRPLTHIVFPQYRPSFAAQSEPLNSVHTLSLLNEGGMLLARDLAREQFEAFLKLICRTPAYKVLYSSLEDAYSMLQTLTS